MAVPTIPEIAPVLLKILAEHGEMYRLDLVEHVIKHFSLTEAEKNERVPSGGTKIGDRTMFASVDIKSAGLLERPRRGYMGITEAGRATLPNLPETIDETYLVQFAPYRAWREAKAKAREESGAEENETDIPASDISPEESIAAGHESIESALADDLLGRILQNDPKFFEKLTIKLVEAMGYGGTEGAGKHLGGPGDGGVDGVVEQDALGLDKIYIQAKRYAPENKIGSDKIDSFAGALGRKQVNKGLFITTSTFTSAAKEAVAELPHNIVLIDGEKLAQMMIHYNVGCRVKATYEIKAPDEDFFEEN